MKSEFEAAMVENTRGKKTKVNKVKIEKTRENYTRMKAA